MPRPSKRNPDVRVKKTLPSGELPAEILKQFLNKSNVIFWAVDLKGNIRMSEGAGLKALKLKPGNLVGKNFLKLFPQNLDIQKVFRRALKGEAFTLNLALENHFYETQFTPWKNARGQRLGSFGLSIDATEKKEAEEALRLSEQRFRNLIENSHDVIALIDSNGRSSFISPSYEKIFGYRIQDRLGHSFFEIIHPEDQPRARQSLERLVQNNGSTVSDRLRAKNRKGEWRTIESSATNHLENPLVRGIILDFRDVTERVLAEENLRRSEQNFRTLIEKLPDAVILRKEDGTVWYANESLLKMLGYDSPEEIIGKNTLDYVHPDDKEAARTRIGRLKPDSGYNPPVERRVLRKDGSTLFVELMAISFLFQGEPTVMTILRDLTDRKIAEMALRDSEEKSRGLIENAYDVILVTSPEGTTQYVSQSLRRVLGYEHEERVGRPFLEIVHPDDRARLAKMLERLIQLKGGTILTSARVLHKNGSWRHIEGAVTNLADNPAVRGIVINYRDVTERIQAEEAQKQSQENFRALIEKSPDAIIIGNRVKLLYANPTFLRLLGYENAEELVGKSWNLFLPPSQMEIVNARVSKLVGVYSANPPIEIRYLKKNGDTLPAEVVSFSVIFEGQMAWAAVIRDLTERKNAEQILLKYTRLGAIGEMAVGLAHEYRNPLSGIGLSAQYLKRKLVEAPDAEIQVQNILDQTERLKQLVNDTLDFSRDSTAQDLVRVDAMDLMQISLRFVQVQFGPRHAQVKVKWAFEKGRFLFFVNQNRIQQVLVNLMLNAYQAMQKGGILTLGCDEEAQKMVLRVEDDGPGISPDVRARLFEPFFTTKQNGSGLGLSVSQRIVEAHGGRLRVESLPQGTAFLVELPVPQGQNTLPPEGSNP